MPCFWGFHWAIGYWAINNNQLMDLAIFHWKFWKFWQILDINWGNQWNNWKMHVFGILQRQYCLFLPCFLVLGKNSQNTHHWNIHIKKVFYFETFYVISFVHSHFYYHEAYRWFIWRHFHHEAYMMIYLTVFHIRSAFKNHIEMQYGCI